MSDTEENTEMTIPCVLVTSCDSGFKEEELIKREFRNVRDMRDMLTLAQQMRFGSSTCI